MMCVVEIWLPALLGELEETQKRAPILTPSPKHATVVSLAAHSGHIE